MPGTRPPRRRRRLAPVPCASRLRAVISIAIALLLLFRQLRDRRQAKVEKSLALLDEKAADRLLGVDAQDRLRDEPGDGQLPDLLAGAGFLAQRDRIGDHELVQARALDALDRRPREHRVRAV